MAEGMIKSNELRLGNLLSYPNWYKDSINKTWSVRDIYFEDNKIGLTDRVIQTITKLDYLHPIPLTEEILLKAGFVNEFSNSWSDNVFQLFENKGNVAGAEIGEFYCSTGQRYVCSFKYLHQLQNLYFALTGQELNTAGLI